MKTLKIVPVPEKMERFFGKGQMLHPSLEMVKELVEKIPTGKITSIGVLTKKMSEMYGTDVTCPMRTGNHLKRMSKEAEATRDGLKKDLPFWRVIRNDGMMVKLEDVPFYASVLEDEGLALTFKTANTIKVSATSSQWYEFL